MSKSRIFFYFCLSFIFGIFIDSIILIPQPIMLGFLIAGILVISVLWNYKKAAIVGFFLIFIVAGTWHHQSAELRIKNNELGKYNDLNEIVTVIGKIIEEPDVRLNSVKLVVGTRAINLHTLNYKNSSKNRILITINRYPEYRYGDELKITGKLKTPADFAPKSSSATGASAVPDGLGEGFDYRNYLAKQGVYSLIDWPDIEVIKEKNYRNWQENFYGKILELKNQFRENINQNLLPPQSSLLAAMVLGDQSKMSKELKDELNITGLRHITAVSGMNVVILCSILMSLLLGLGFWRGQAFYLALFLIFLFVLMIGFQPSAVRAGIMGGLLLLAQKVGRKSASFRTVATAATLMLIINPLLLMSDIGFQLSFLAILGMVFFQPRFLKWLNFIPEKNFLNLRSILATTFSAQIFTLPILIYNFGQVSLVSPITNILILPVIYWIMIFGGGLMILGLIWQPLTWILIIPCWLLLTYSLKIIDIFSQSWAIKTFENVHWIWLVILYFILGFIVWRLSRTAKLKFLDY